ncbi:hypothetical protein F4782DRAFT_532116 [Xylaria castorea]|nr:hypothetical protein F4782DRAFT_532116 [Xylaria castorea]
MPPKPSTTLPPSKHAHDDDTRSLISVPSLTGTGSTIDSISVVGESPTGPTAHISLIDASQKLANFSSLHAFGFIDLSDTKGKLGCQTCKTEPERLVVIECKNCALRLCQLCFNVHARLPSCKSESRLELIESQYNSTSNGTAGLVTFLSDEDDPWPLRKLVHQTHQSALQTALGHDPQQVAIRDDGSLTFGNDDDAVVASHNLFRVIILARHSGIQHAYAAEIQGERCYVSKELLEIYNIDPEVDRVRVTWQKFGEFDLTHTWFEILKPRRIGGKADLFLGRGYETQRPNIGEALQYARELDLTHPTYQAYPAYSLSPLPLQLDAMIVLPRQRPGTKNHTTHREDSRLDSPSMITCQDVEDSYDEITEEECSWTSSSDESYITSRGPVETRKEQMIGNITLTITQWLRSQFTRGHTSAHETTAGSCEGRSTPSSASAQYQKDQVQRAGKRKVGNADSDKGENNDDDTVRPPYPGADDMKGKGKEIVRFACPYFKYNPTKYRQWPICPGPGWSDVHRVKEHLYRKHRQPRFRCVRCWQCFDSEQNYVDHQRALVSCELGEREPVEGFDTNQERQLRSRKKKSHIVSETDKWNAVYQILFPHVSSDKIPSPFYEHETHAYEALTECQEYVLREIPLRLRETLAPEFDRDFQIIEQSLQRRAIESTRTIVATLFEEFRKLHQQGAVTTMVPMLRGSQDHADPSSSQAQPSWLDSMESSRMFLDQTEFDFDFAFADGSQSLFGDVQLQDIPEAPTDPENPALKQSDSGYESNIVERPNEQGLN